MIKNTLIFTAVGLGVCGIFELAGLMAYLSFADKIFIVSLVYILIGGSLFLEANGYFNLQKYAFKKVGRKLPLMFSFLSTPNARAARLEAEQEDEEDKEKKFPKDYNEYLEKYATKKEASTSFPALISAVVLVILSIVISG